MDELKDIIKQCKEKNAKAEYVLYKKCFKIFMPICYRYSSNRDDAVSLLNNGFYKVLNNIKQYKEELDFEKWAKSILINSIIDEFRTNKKYKENNQITDFSEHTFLETKFDINYATEKINSEEIITEIGKLPNMSKEVLNLYIFEGFSHKEIGAFLKISESTSRWHLAHARNILRSRLSSILSSFKMLVL